MRCYKRNSTPATRRIPRCFGGDGKAECRRSGPNRQPNKPKEVAHVVEQKTSVTRQRSNVNVACENSRFSLLFAAKDVSRGITSATQRQKFHADDVRSVRNPVRSADWSTEYLHCLRITDKREKATRVKCQRDESLTLQSKLVDDILLFRKIYREKHKIEQIWMWNPMTTGCVL